MVTTYPKGRFIVTRTPAPKPDWKPKTQDYSELTAFKFGTKEELDQAIDVFFDETDLKGAPFRSVGRNTIFVPDEAVALLESHLQTRSVAFETSQVHDSDSLGKNLPAPRRELKLSY